MPNYQRFGRPGASYFFTVVTYRRYPWLCSELGRAALRQAIRRVRDRFPFRVNAFVLLPDHLHCIWTLPEEDSNFSIRWSLIKRFSTQYYTHHAAIDVPMTRSRHYRKESNLWQRRFWERRIRDEFDFQNSCNYILLNPIKHRLIDASETWPYLSISSTWPDR